mgnify:FL=1
MFMAEAHLCNVDDNDTTSTPTRVERAGRAPQHDRQPERQAKTDQRYNQEDRPAWASEAYI